MYLTQHITAFMQASVSQSLWPRAFEFLKWLVTPAIFFSILVTAIRIFRAKPKIKIEIHKDASCLQSGGSPINSLSFTWGRKFIFHNNSNHLARGIQLASDLPKGFKFQSGLPTKLEADEKLPVDVEIQLLDVNRDELVQKYGEHSDLSTQLFTSILNEISFQIAFKNKYGGKFYQRFQFNYDQITSEVSWKKIKTPHSNGR